MQELSNGSRLCVPCGSLTPFVPVSLEVPEYLELGFGVNRELPGGTLGPIEVPVQKVSGLQPSVSTRSGCYRIGGPYFLKFLTTSSRM